MPYTLKEWHERHVQRIDISSAVTHFTREAVINGESLSVLQVLLKILQEGKIKGSVPPKGFIVGSRPAVCFQNAPLLALAQNVAFERKLATEKHRKVRYRGVGVAFGNHTAFLKGARPVIYERTSEAKYILPPDEHWRIVNLDLSNYKEMIDWTHEREWRAPGDFEFKLEEAGVIVETSQMFNELIGLLEGSMLKRLRSITVLDHALA